MHPSHIGRGRGIETPHQHLIVTLTLLANRKMRCIFFKETKKNEIKHSFFSCYFWFNISSGNLRVLFLASGAFPHKDCKHDEGRKAICFTWRTYHCCTRDFSLSIALNYVNFEKSDVVSTNLPDPTNIECKRPIRERDTTIVCWVCCT